MYTETWNLYDVSSLTHHQVLLWVLYVVSMNKTVDYLKKYDNVLRLGIYTTVQA